MSGKLIFHETPGDSSAPSPFWEAIAETVTNADVALACPYLEPKYIAWIAQKSRSWRLITDIYAWLQSYSGNTRKAAYDFIRENTIHIRDQQGLHAKLVLSDNAAVFGSANLTGPGMKQNVELGIHVSDQQYVQELKTWYDAIWAEAAPYSPSCLDQIFEHLPVSDPKTQRNTGNGRRKLPTRGVVDLDSGDHSHSGNNAESSETYQRLVKAVSEMPDRTWAEWFFAWGRELLEALALSPDDPRIVTSMPKKSNCIRITIGRRLILGAESSRGEQRLLALLETPTFSGDVPLGTMLDQQTFDPRIDEYGNEAPWLLYYEAPELAPCPGHVMEGWIRQCNLELKRVRRSPYWTKGYHRPEVYRTIMEDDYRSRVLDEAFPESAR